jgi:hypothetical protein
MQQMKFRDQQVQQAIAHFISDTRRSAETPTEDTSGGIRGLAAISTILAVAVAVGEVFVEEARGQESTRATVKAFYNLMVDKTSWLKPPVGTSHSDERARELLADIRDSLLHALSLPPDVMLLPDQRPDTQLGPEERKRWSLVVPDFIDAVDKTIKKINADREKRCKPWNPSPRSKGKDREPVEIRKRDTL